MNARLRPLRLVLGPALAGLLTAGCTSSALYFATETSGGLKVSGAQAAPTGVSLAYQRAEIALIPPKTDGTTHAVFGGVDHDYSWTDGFLLAQTFATGRAAVIAAGGQPADTRAGQAGDNQAGKLFFSTVTTFGLDLNLGADLGASVPSLVLGFRRAEATVIPIKDPSREVNSVYADISIAEDSGGLLKTHASTEGGTRRHDVGPDRIPASPNGTRIRQTFATGDAAIAVAGRGDAQDKLAAAAGLGQAYYSATTLGQQRDTVLAKLSTVTDPARQTALLAKANSLATAAGIPTATTWADLPPLVLNLNGDQLTQLQNAFPELKP